MGDIEQKSKNNNNDQTHCWLKEYQNVAVAVVCI